METVAQKLAFKQEEAKIITFTMTENALPLDISLATLSFAIKKSKSDATYEVYKTDAEIDKTDAAIGIVRINLSVDNLSLDVGKHYGELRTHFSSENIDKSDDIEITIEKAVIGKPPTP